MRTIAGLCGALLCLVAPLVTAQGAGTRAWQQRLHVEIPMAVPMDRVEPANPFAMAVDTPPRLVSSSEPRKMDLRGRAVVAAYVDARGDCLGAVPLELPFPGMTSVLLAEFTGSRFEPAKVGERAVPSWVVVEIQVETKVKDAEVVSQDLRLPDPSIPPTPVEDTPPRPSGQLTNLPFSPLSSLSETALPKRIRLRLSGSEHEETFRALVHISSQGRCDKYVPLDVPSGLDMWFANFLGSWSLHPAQRDGQVTESWMVYTARVRLKLGSLGTDTFGVDRQRAYDPMDAAE